MRWFWATAIKPLLDAAEPRTIVEVGILAADTTRSLVEYASTHDGVVHGIDPAPQPAAIKLAERNERFVLHRQKSLDALPHIPDIDAALIDGDHNWYTVINELRLLASQSESQGRDFPLTLLHDIGWPYGRRDQYCDPDAIPEEFRQPIARGGLWPGDQDLHDDSGINVGGRHAINEGTPQNGVLTAVEDFVSESDGRFQFASLAGLHGLGILGSTERLAANEALRTCLSDLRSPAWLSAECARLEQERLMTDAQLHTLRHRVKVVARAADRPGP